MRTIATVDNNGQVVIPAGIRRAVGLDPSHRVDVSLRGGEVVLTPLPRDLVAFLEGSLREGPSILDYLLREHEREARHAHPAGQEGAS